MKIVILGLGSMGKEVVRSALLDGHEIIAQIDPIATNASNKELTDDIAQKADIAIEFTIASAVIDNAKKYAAMNLPAVVGTTGWSKDLEKVSSIISNSSIPYLHATNFSLGIQLFNRLVATATQLVDSFSEYDLSITERHHRRKADSPSGTALTLSETVLANSSEKKIIVTERLARQINNDELHVSSVRGGEDPGTHTLFIDSQDDSIELTHRARSRTALARGALKVANWLISEPKKAGIYSIDDFMNEILNHSMKIDT